MRVNKIGAKYGYGAKAIIVFNQEFLILTKPNGDYDLPGGRLCPKESFQDCINREVFEETALNRYHMP